ncbi:hypothetical protein J6590_102167, partial [Homalodisca vitripennis]
IKQRRARLLLGWVTAEQPCPCKQPACPAIDGGSEVTFKPLVPRLSTRLRHMLYWCNKENIMVSDVITILCNDLHLKQCQVRSGVTFSNQAASCDSGLYIPLGHLYSWRARSWPRVQLRIVYQVYFSYT